MLRVLLILSWLLPHVAVAADLKLATWNLEWLTLRAQGDPALPDDVTPKRAEDIERLRHYAELLDADVIAFQEVDGPTVAAEVFTPDRYVIHTTGDDVVQRVGLAVRRGLAFTSNPDLTALDVYPPDAPHHLRSGADITLTLPGGTLRILAVHLKTGCRFYRLTEPTQPCATLARQLPQLQSWVAAREREGVPFVVMGDFNRWMDGHDAFFAALDAGGDLRRATAGHSSPCWGGGGFIDHIIAGGPARDWMDADSLRVLVYREIGAEWKERLSDHCPVSARFHLPD